MFWEAYQDLQTERRHPRGRISALAIVHYARAYGLDPDQLKRIVWRVDEVLLEHWENQDKAEKAKRERERELDKGART